MDNLTDKTKLQLELFYMVKTWMWELTLSAQKCSAFITLNMVTFTNAGRIDAELKHQKFP